MRYAYAVGAAVLAVLAACASGTTQPPSARELASRVPGCHPASAQVSVYARQEVTCAMRGGLLDLATFTSTAGERKWIAGQGAHNGNCCVQGHLWAATVDGAPPVAPLYRQVTGAIGGRQVTYP